MTEVLAGWEVQVGDRVEITVVGTVAHIDNERGLADVCDHEYASGSLKQTRAQVNLRNPGVAVRLVERPLEQFGPGTFIKPAGRKFDHHYLVAEAGDPKHVNLVNTKTGSIGLYSAQSVNNQKYQRVER